MVVEVGFCGWGLGLGQKNTGLGWNPGPVNCHAKCVESLQEKCCYVVIDEVYEESDGEVRKARVPGCCLLVRTCGVGGTGGAFAGRVWV